MKGESGLSSTANILELGQRAKQVTTELAGLNSTSKNQALLNIAGELNKNTTRILEVNQQDVADGKEQGLSSQFLERLTLNKQRIENMILSLQELVNLKDPIGDVEKMWRRPNGLEIGQVRVPLGVVAIIYESRPNVTIDAAALCLKTGNAVILRGGSEALRTNQVLVDLFRVGLAQAGVPADAVQLVSTPERSAVHTLMRMNDYVDVLIPRGGAGLIKTVVEKATVPVIETGVGNCHIFVDASMELESARRIVFNAKTQRPSVCNAVETLLVHRDIAPGFLPLCGADLKAAGVEIRGCVEARRYLPWAKQATDEDWATEYLDLILAVKVVSGLEEALAHIRRYGTRHSESVLTSDYRHARHFLQTVDAAAVYVNASTRFTDGFEFGFGAELGISTQKLHARGPMGLEALTTLKYIIYGSGQIRS